MRLPEIVQALIVAELAKDAEARHLSEIESRELQALLDNEPGEAGMGLQVIVSGNPVDGIRIYGPYATAQEAANSGHKDKRLDDYWIAPLLPAKE